MSAMYEQLLKKHLDDKREYGESPQLPCGPQELERARKRAKAELSVDLPAAYLALLAVTNGLDSNGLVIYASETSPVVGHEATGMSIEGIVEANLGWREYEPHRRYLVFAESGGILYAHDLNEDKYKLLDRQSNDVVLELRSFEELIHRALADNQP